MQIKSRKKTRLENYDYGQNGAYFVTICTKDRKRILSNIIVGTGVLDCPKTQLLNHGKIAEKYINQLNNFYDNVSVDKYIIMPDHIHLIIQIDNGTMWASSPTNKIASIVRSIKTLTTKEVGKPIFQRSYYDHIIRNQEDYNEIWEYIENNPRKWALKTK